MAASRLEAASGLQAYAMGLPQSQRNTGSGVRLAWVLG